MFDDISSYDIVVSGGSGGYIIYREERGEIRFWWEYVYGGVFVQVPSEAEWDHFCAAQRAPWAVGQRGQILIRVLEGLDEGKAGGMDPESYPDGILFRIRPHATQSSFAADNGRP